MSLSVGIINYFTGAILTFRILYIMFNLFELLSIKYTMFPYGVQIMLSYVEISPIGLYTYYLFSSCFIYYIHSLTLRIISPILCCTCHIYRVRPCVVFHHALPCTCTYDRGTHRLSPLHIVLLSPLPWWHQNSLKIHIRQGKIN